jgi:hypothetical protein
MSLETDIIMLLRRTPTVRELVDTRIHQDRRPQGFSEPAIVVQRETGGYSQVLSGFISHSQPSLSVACYAPRAPQANKLRDSVRRALQGFGGVVGHTKFGSIVLDDEDHDFIFSLDGDGGTFVRRLIFRVISVPFPLGADAVFPGGLSWNNFSEDDWNNFTQDQWYHLQS